MATNRREHLFITEHLRAAGLSDEEAGEKLGKGRETIWRWANQQNRLNPKKIRLLADLCGIEPADFWRMPGSKSIDALLKEASQEERDLAADIVSRLLKKKPTP